MKKYFLWKSIVSLFSLTAVLFGFGALHSVSAQSDSGQVSSWRVPEEKASVTNTIPANEQSIAAGKAVYARECLACHGVTGRGDGPQAKDLDKKVPGMEVINGQTDGALFYKIGVGRKPMPSYKKTLTDEERWQVVNYLRTLSPSASDTNKK